MTRYIKVDESFVEQIVKTANWAPLGDVVINEGTVGNENPANAEPEDKVKRAKFEKDKAARMDKERKAGMSEPHVTGRIGNTQRKELGMKPDPKQKPANPKGNPKFKNGKLGYHKEEAEVEVAEAELEEYGNKPDKRPIKKVKIKTDDSPEGKKKKADDDYDHERAEKMRQSTESVEETHECPLCESVLEEALTDEQIMEHVASIQEALNTIEESGKEPTDAELDAIEAEDDDDDLEEKMSADDAAELKDQHKHHSELDGSEDGGDDKDFNKDQKARKKASVMKKVKELKRVAHEGMESDPRSGIAGDAARLKKAKKGTDAKVKPSPEDAAKYKKSFDARKAASKAAATKSTS